MCEKVFKKFPNVSKVDLSNKELNSMTPCIFLFFLFHMSMICVGMILKALSNLTPLRTLVLQQIHISEQCMIQLSKSLPNLRHLDLSFCQLSMPTLDNLKISNLKELVMRENHWEGKDHLRFHSSPSFDLLPEKLKRGLFE